MEGEKYFKTHSKVLAYSILYVTGRNFYKFNEEDGRIIYSFQADEEFYRKLKLLDDIRFDKNN